MTSEKRYTRQELYDLVWKKPISQLGPELGLSDRGLAKICERHNIPTPNRGYWAKFEARKRVTKTRLPKSDASAPRFIFIRASAPASDSAIQAAAQEKEIRQELDNIDIPKTLNGLHPIVGKWIEDHKVDRAETRRRSRGRKDDWFAPNVRAELTDRDRYRFRVTSAFLKAIEACGGVVKSGNVRGKLVLEVCGETAKCTIAEKMLQKPGALHDQSWTAWPEHFNSNLTPSGFLRLTLDSWGYSGQTFVESDSRGAEVLLPRLIAKIIALGPHLVAEREAREEWRRQFEKEQAERAERQRLARLDEARWDTFRGLARDWEESVRLRQFLQALQELPESDAPASGEHVLKDWMAWAEEKISQMDPLANGAMRVLSDLSTVKTV